VQTRRYYAALFITFIIFSLKAIYNHIEILILCFGVLDNGRPNFCNNWSGSKLLINFEHPSVESFKASYVILHSTLSICFIYLFFSIVINITP
jgi:hypothetical protein